ncbi:MAG: DUF3380 domain-containing protein [Bacteroidetes bacterium]|nr:DUF3380 domain-containing protein [Bacteroidota bacterium]
MPAPKIYDSKGLSIQYSKLPINTDYKDSVSLNALYIPFQELSIIYVEKIGDKWLYSEATVDAIPNIHKSIFKFGTDKFLTLLPKAGSDKFLGIRIWQWLGMLIIFLLSTILYFLFRWVFGFFIYRIVKRFISPILAKTFIKPLSKPLSGLLLSLLFLIFIPLLQFGAKATKVLIIIDTVIISLFVIIMLYRLVDVLSTYMFRAAIKSESTLDDQLVPLVTKSMKVFIVIIGVLFILQNLDFNIMALLAGISIGGIAFALAAQDTIKNLFGSLMIFLDKPFQIGDWIINDSVDGTVEEVGFRSTRIRTFQNSLISIPNGKLADLAIDNMGLREYRRFKTDLSLTYDTPPAKVESFIEGIRAIIKTHPHTRKDYYIVQLNSLGSYSINVMLYVFFISETWQLELKYRHELLILIMKLAEELKIRWAFPTETLFIEEVPGKPTLTPRHQTDKEEHRRKINTFIGHMKRNTQHSPKQVQSKPVQQSSEQKEESPVKAIIPKLSKIKDKIKQVADIKKSSTEQERIEQQISEKSIKKGKELTENEIIDAANKYKIDLAVLKAVIEVEAKAKGFYAEGKPSIAFHGQKFWKELEKRNIDPNSLVEKYPDIVYPRWSRKYIRHNEKEYERLEIAKSIEKESAYLSTNWGMFQLSGYDYKRCGFNNVNEFVFNLYKTEKEQLEAFCQYLVNRKLIEDIQEHNWKEFANKYNGPANTRYRFDQRLEKAYQKYSAAKK